MNTYINRELSWLKFNERVLEEAESEIVPLCERLGFASIFQSNLDEFFMVRVGSLEDQMLVSRDLRDNKTRMTAAEQISAILKEVSRLNRRRDAVYAALMSRLEEQGVRLVNFQKIGEQESGELERYFDAEIALLLSPTVVSKRQPFPFLQNKEIYAVGVLAGKNGGEKLGIIPCGTGVFPRLIRVPGQPGAMMLSEELILHFLPKVFSSHRVVSKSLIRVTRNADIDADALYDEENNIEWSRRLEEAGCQVIYGLDGYKVHCKLCLVTRRADGQTEYYTQIGTGNYNEKTARLYTDLSLMTADPAIGMEAAAVFQALAMGETVEDSQQLLVAPKCLQNRILALIDREIACARKGEPAYIGIKINSLTDKTIIDRLILASQEGVKIDLVVRGICCLLPGVPGDTENIRVISIVGRFLEHSRIYIFGAESRQSVYIASADFMTRNTLRRVEVAAPILDAGLRRRLTEMFRTMLQDNQQARELKNTGEYIRVRNDATPLNCQEFFYRQAYQQAAESAEAAPAVPVSPEKPRQLRSWLLSAFRKGKK